VKRSEIRIGQRVAQDAFSGQVCQAEFKGRHLVRFWVRWDHQPCDVTEHVARDAASFRAPGYHLHEPDGSCWPRCYGYRRPWEL
jgi:hypothetical protein